jgi:hypothetical protein
MHVKSLESIAEVYDGLNYCFRRHQRLDLVISIDTAVSLEVLLLPFTPQVLIVSEAADVLSVSHLKAPTSRLYK